MGLYFGGQTLATGGGATPYQAAVEGGYQGTEEDFNQILAIIPSAEKQDAWDDKADDSDLTAHSSDGTVHVTATEKQSWNAKADAATTLAGYGITDGVTKTVADSSYAAKTHTHTASDVGAIATSAKGVAGGVASLGDDGKIPSAQVPDVSVDAYTKEETLKDATAALYGLGTDAVPDDVLVKIKPLIDAANANANTKPRIATGTYVGTSTEYGMPRITITVGFPAKLFCLFVDGGKFKLLSAPGATVPGTYDSSFVGTFTGIVEFASYVYALNSEYGALVKFSDTEVVLNCQGKSSYSNLNNAEETYRWYAIG